MTFEHESRRNRDSNVKFAPLAKAEYDRLKAYEISELAREEAEQREEDEARRFRDSSAAAPRKKNGMTWKQLSAACGVSQPTISRKRRAMT